VSYFVVVVMLTLSLSGGNLGRLVGCKNILLKLQAVKKVIVDIVRIILNFIAVIFFPLAITFCSYKKLAIFTTNVDAENQCLINHKCVCGVLNRQFLVGAVISWPSVCRGCEVLVCREFRCHCRVVFGFVCVACALLVLKILEGEILKNNFSLGGKGESSIAIFGLCRCLVRIAIVLTPV
jgi:hypothetical protein